MGTMPDCSDKDDIECKPWVGTESSGKIEDVEKSYHHLGADNTNLSLVKGWLEDALLKLLIFIGGLISYVSIPIIISQFFIHFKNSINMSMKVD